MSEWKEVKLGDICTELSDGLHKAPLFVEGGDYIFVNAKNLCDGVIVDNDPTKKTTHEEYLKYSKPLNENTILFSIDGTIGNIARYKGEKCVLGKGACYINPNPVHVDSSYIYFQLQSPHFNSYLNCMSTGSTIKHISLKTMRNYEFTLPPLSEQRSIASILSALDDKIAVNRRICENLEAQAQALFKHWFIDFAPFLDKPSGKAERKNGQFVESELGMIPEGWRVGTLSEIADINPSRTIKKGTISTYLDMKNMPTSGSFPINWENKEFVGGMKFKNGDTLMARITPCLENGKVAYANFLRDGEIAFGSTEYIVMTAKESIFPEFLYTLCRFPSFVNYAVKNMNGSSGRQRVSGETISNYRMVIAPESVYSSVRPIFQEYMLRIRECGFENLRLSTLRDTLLPKLMSGQIKV